MDAVAAVSYPARAMTTVILVTSRSLAYDSFRGRPFVVEVGEDGLAEHDDGGGTRFAWPAHAYQPLSAEGLLMLRFLRDLPEDRRQTVIESAPAPIRDELRAFGLVRDASDGGGPALACGWEVLGRLPPLAG